MSNDKQFEYKTRHGNIEQVKITLDFYADNNNLYLGMESFDVELGGMVPYTDITVNTIDMPYLFSAIDTNNNGEEIVAFLEENGFGEDTGKVVSSGYCIYPVFKFNEEALQRVCPYEFREYQKAHGIEPQEREKSLGDLAQEAKERSAEKNGNRVSKQKEAGKSHSDLASPSKESKTHKPPEAGR